MKKIILFLFVISSVNLVAQDNLKLSYHLPQDVSYNAKIPTPASIIGHEVGEWHVTHDKLVAYMKALAAASDRISIEDRGKTFEDRPLLLLKITSPENQRNLEEIRLNHLKISDSKENKSMKKIKVLVTSQFN